MNIKQQHKYHYFYKITNLINGHFYYGVHNNNNLDDGYMGSGTRLQNAYRKYGIENFKKEIIKYFNNKEEAFEYESGIVNEELITNNECYNLSIGGKGGFIPNINSYKKNPSPNLNKVMVKFKNTDKYFFINTNQYDKTIYETNWTNRHHTEESKNKIRQTLTPKNSTNDHIWVNDGNGNVKYLNKKKLDEYINNGWSLGRKGYKPRKGQQGKILMPT